MKCAFRDPIICYGCTCCVHLKDAHVHDVVAFPEYAEMHPNNWQNVHDCMVRRNERAEGISMCLPPL